MGAYGERRQPYGVETVEVTDGAVDDQAVAAKAGCSGWDLLTCVSSGIGCSGTDGPGGGTDAAVILAIDG